MNDKMKNKRIAVLMGGLSKEREISLKSGKGVSRALKEAGYKNVIDIDVDFNVAEKLKDLKIDTAFIALHGKFGEDGAIQGILEHMRIPYTGSGVLGSCVAINKVMSKRVFESLKIPTPDYLVFDDKDTDKAVRKIKEKHLGYPLIVKPSSEGSTIGLTLVKEEKELIGSVELAFDHDKEILIEKYIKGKELTVGVLDGKPLPVVEIVPKSGLFDYDAKYTKGLTDYYVPARIESDIAKRVQKLGSLAFNALKCEGLGRTDVLLDDKNNPYVIEVNTIPGFTETSLVPMAAKEIGIDYMTLVEQILAKASLKIQK